MKISQNPHRWHPDGKHCLGHVGEPADWLRGAPKPLGVVRGRAARAMAVLKDLGSGPFFLFSMFNK